jgi:hypothetical protein
MNTVSVSEKADITGRWRKSNLHNGQLRNLYFSQLFDSTVQARMSCVEHASQFTAI